MKRPEPYHWKEAIGTAICCFAGLVLMTSSGSSEHADFLLLGGIALIGLSVVALVITDGWQHASDLPVAKKFIAYLPPVLGGVATIAVIAIFWIAWQAIKEAIEEA